MVKPSGNQKRSRIWDPRFPFDPSRGRFFYGWVIVVAGTVGIIASIPGQTVGVSVFTGPLSEAMGLTVTGLSTAYLFGTGVAGLLVPWSGRLFDRWGARRMIVGVSLCFAGANIFVGIADHIAGSLARLLPFVDPGLVATATISVGFLLSRFLGQAVLTATSRNMIGKWFSIYRGRAMAVSSVAASLAFAIAPKALDLILEAFGWRGAYLVMGCLVGVGMTALGWLLFRDNPEECGLEMDDGAREDSSRAGNPELTVVKEFTAAEAIRGLAFWMYAFPIAWQSFFITGYLFHIVAIGDELGLGKDRILNLMIPTSLCAIATNFAVGWLADRVRTRRVLQIFLLGVVVSPVAMLLVTRGQSGPAVMLMVVSQGLAWGCFPIMLGVVWPRFYGREHLGEISGLSLAMAVVASAVGPLVFSLCNDLAGGFWPVFGLGSLVPLLFLLMTPAVENPQRRFH